jgi:hypothetical protein
MQSKLKNHHCRAQYLPGLQLKCHPKEFLLDNLYNSVVIYQNLSERFVEKHQTKFNMYYYLRSNYDRVTQDFFEKHVNKLSKYEKNSLHSIVARSLKPTTKINEDERR